KPETGNRNLKPTLAPLLVIVGPTGVGKTAAAVRLAGRIPMEAVNADSRQVYRGMDIGTGKPTAEERRALRHHLLDVVRPDEPYHAQRFRSDALGAIADIRARGRLPVVVGGTGLYVRALLKGLHPAPPADPALREALEALAAAEGTPALHARLRDADAAAAARLHPNDRVRLIRALEKCSTRRATGEASEYGNAVDTSKQVPAAHPSEYGNADWATAAPPFKLLMVGLRQARAALDRRLADRVRAMVAGGMMDEVRGLREAGYATTLPAMGGIGYRQLAAVLEGALAEAEAIRLMIRDTRRYAKRQMTWFARDAEIRWLDVDATGGPEGTADAIWKLITEEGLTE
ncbi:MAG TPA: tRNA (adenosine(37)-N6)-dimethylallyltransferase MiaA, partial [Candidatus Limnocylindrales bacterium]|nr:tRNA (adenosine(37)-N6)-dimethylallyltransferase MiaA [Candidatus Limnocylindrales bacterium]